MIGEDASAGPLALSLTHKASAAGKKSSWVVNLAVDEIGGIDWFGEFCPPYWRRALPVNDSTVVPTEMLSAAHSQYEAVRTACDSFDSKMSDKLAAVGGEKYATLTQLTYPLRKLYMA